MGEEGLKEVLFLLTAKGEKVNLHCKMGRDGPK